MTDQAPTVEPTDVPELLAVAWPPPIPANTRANATPQLTTHPTDHNQIADALTVLTQRVRMLDLAVAKWSMNTIWSPGAANVAVPYNLKDLDPMNMYGPPNFTVPYSGAYLCTATLFMGASAANQGAQIQVYRNGALAVRGTPSNSTGAQSIGSMVSVIMSLLAGDRVSFVANCVPVTLSTTYADSANNYASVAYLGQAS